MPFSSNVVFLSLPRSFTAASLWLLSIWEIFARSYPIRTVFQFLIFPSIGSQREGLFIPPSIINWELFCRLSKRIFVNFLWTTAITTKRAGTQHIKSAGDDLSPYLWWNYVLALKFRNLQGLLFSPRRQTLRQERRSRNPFRRLPCVSFQIFSCGLSNENKV